MSHTIPATTTIRIYPQTRQRIQRMSAMSRKSTAEVVDELVTAAEERAMIVQFNAYFEDPERKAEFHRSETAPLDATLADGLEGLE